MGEREEGGHLLCILSMCTHTPPPAVVLKALLCVCEWCEGCTDTQLLQIILKVNISLAGSCLRWSLLSWSEEDVNLPRHTRDTKQACDAVMKTSNWDSREPGDQRISKIRSTNHQPQIPFISFSSVMGQNQTRARVLLLLLLL